MAFILVEREAILAAFVDAAERCTLKHLLHHRVELGKLGKAGLALAALLRFVCFNASATHDFVAARTIFRIECNVVAVGAGGPREHCVRPSVQLLHLWLNMLH